jgi:hypothetical protein
MKNKLPFLFVILITLSSCGVISKARYGNGLKINLDFGKKSEKNIALKNSKEKKKPTVKIQNIQNQVEETTDFSTEIASSISPFNNIENETSYSNLTLNQIPKKPLLDKIEKKKAILKSYLKPNQPKLKNDERPYERNAMWGGILFYGGLFLGLFIPFISIVMVLPGLLLSSYSLGVIKTSGYAYRGYGMALSVLVVYFALMIIGLLLLAAFYASF